MVGGIITFCSEFPHAASEGTSSHLICLPQPLRASDASATQSSLLQIPRLNTINTTPTDCPSRLNALRDFRRKTFKWTKENLCSEGKSQLAYFRAVHPVSVCAFHKTREEPPSYSAHTNRASNAKPGLLGYYSTASEFSFHLFLRIFHIKQPVLIPPPPPFFSFLPATSSLWITPNSPHQPGLPPPKPRCSSARAD